MKPEILFQYTNMIGGKFRVTKATNGKGYDLQEFSTTNKEWNIVAHYGKMSEMVARVKFSLVHSLKRTYFS